MILAKDSGAFYVQNLEIKLCGSYGVKNGACLVSTFDIGEDDEDLFRVLRKDISKFL
jgi:hypothetical protein